jgi:hypothetical protein
MESLPLAFSVHKFINSVGADAGFAAIVGLAILVLLYFAQARETSVHRDRASEFEQRILQLEALVGRLQQLVRQQPAPAVAPRPDGVPLTAGNTIAPPLAVPGGGPGPGPAIAASRGARAPVVPLPAAPAGVGAPALAAATRLIPTAVVPVAAASVEAPAAPTAPAQDGTQAPATPAEPIAPAGADSAAPAAVPDATAVVTPPPATVAGGGNGARHDPVPAPVPSDLAAQQPPGRVQIRADAGPEPARPPAPLRRRPAPPPRRLIGEPPARSAAGRRVAIAIGAVLVAAVIVALVLITQGGGGTKAKTGSRTTNAPTTPRHKPKPPPFANSSVTVNVLNGTSTSGLAHRVTQVLVAAGYKTTTATASDQTHATTIVAFMSGHRQDALAVAATLKLSSSTVAPIDSGTQSVACPPGTACSVTVVVTVGNDLANIP